MSPPCTCSTKSGLRSGYEVLPQDACTSSPTGKPFSQWTNAMPPRFCKRDCSAAPDCESAVLLGRVISHRSVEPTITPRAANALRDSIVRRRRCRSLWRLTGAGPGQTWMPSLARAGPSSPRKRLGTRTHGRRVISYCVVLCATEGITRGGPPSSCEAYRRSERHLRERGDRVQFSSFSVLTRSNSTVLFVTSVRPSARACAAMNRSLAPISVPLLFRSARISA